MKGKKVMRSINMVINIITLPFTKIPLSKMVQSGWSSGFTERSQRGLGNC